MSLDFAIPVTQDMLTALSPLDQLRGRWSSNIDVPTERLAQLEAVIE